MKGHFYFEVMRRTIIQFLNLFNDIKIARYSNTGELEKYVAVPLKFAPKSKHWWWEEKLDADGRKIHDIILPYIGINMTDIELASGRLVNKKHKVKSERIQESKGQKLFPNPVPYDYNFEVKIASQYMIDATQILEQILPFFDPTGFIRVTIPELFIRHKEEGDEQGAYPMDLKVIYNGATSDISIDMTEEEYRTIIWTLSFKVEGYLYKPAKVEPIMTTPIISYYNQEGAGWPEVPQAVSEIVGLSGDKYPLTLSGSPSAALSGAYYSPSIKLWYTYEREGD